MGNFNVVRCAEEMLESSFNLSEASVFNSFINSAELLDPPPPWGKTVYLDWQGRPQIE